MAGDIKNKYGTSGQAITITIASLTNNAARASTAVDNTSNLFVDVLVSVKLTAASSSTSSSGYVTIYAYGTADGGTTYTDGATGSDAAITLTVPPNVRPIGVVNVVADSATYIGGPFSVAAAFNGVLPDHWGIILVNASGATLDSTAGNHFAKYQGVLAQYT
jgi:hypothetical protein